MSVSARLNEDLSSLNDSMVQVDQESSPFVSKQMVTVLDVNPNSVYASGQVIFQTDNISSNGLYADMRNAVVEIPMVFVIEQVGTTTADFDSTADQAGLDYILSTKCSEYCLINTMSIVLDGGSVVSHVDNISSYFIWIKID